MNIRPLTPDDREQSWRLGVESFGGPPPGTPIPDAPTRPSEGSRTLGAFDDQGRLAAKVTGLDAGSWFAGAAVPTCAVAGVAVAAEHRGRGLLRPLFEALTRDAVSRGQCLSTLFPTANGIYRSLGYEVVSSFDTVEIPTAQLAGPPPTHTTTRRATLDDVPAIRAVYARWAAAQHGPLTRVGPPFETTGQELLDELTAITLAVDDDEQITGYLAWRRGDSYRPDAVLEVDELVAVDADAVRALWAVLASFASVTGSVRLTSSGDDLARHVLRTSTWDVVNRHPYALRLLDLPAAIAARGAHPPLAPAVAEIGVRGDRLGLLDGGYRLTVDADSLGCERTGPAASGDAPTFTAGGIGLLWAGAQTCANLRFLGHLSGPADHDAVLDAVFGGAQLHIRDYF